MALESFKGDMILFFHIDFLLSLKFMKKNEWGRYDP